MSIPSIQSAVQQIQTLAAQATDKNEKASQSTVAVGKDSFVDELHASIERINQLQKAAGTSVKAFELGDPSVTLNDVMVDKQKAGLSFEMGIQVRNRFIQSYKEIMNMQV